MAALVAYIALSDRMAKLEAGASLSIHRITTIEVQIERIGIQQAESLRLQSAQSETLRHILDELRDTRRR